MSYFFKKIVTARQSLTRLFETTRSLETTRPTAPLQEVKVVEYNPFLCPHTAININYTIDEQLILYPEIVIHSGPQYATVIPDTVIDIE